MISANDIETIIELIEKRFDQVVEANNIEKDENNFQYSWIKGVYDDIAQYLKIALQ
jgi:hypothetical protein